VVQVFNADHLALRQVFNTVGLQVWRVTGKLTCPSVSPAPGGGAWSSCGRPSPGTRR
jgi:hypothetical protein